MDGRALVEAPAERLEEFVHCRYLVEAGAGRVWTGRRDGSGSGAAAAVAEFADQPGDPIENLVAACYGLPEVA